jgi:homoserine O-succinyltransferase
VALVNNMPDSAFVETEDQFRRAVSSDPDSGAVELALYTITEIERSAATTAVIRERYAGLDELWTNPPDAMIVTGTEPTQTQLAYEPYWPYLAQLLGWAAESVPTTLLSCLASHASVFLFDGIERVPRLVKCSGVYAGAVDHNDPLADGLPSVVPVPHSRLNDVSEDALIDADYRIVIGSGPTEIGWTVAARRCGDSLFVLCQGHPEYSTLSLLREYRRDVRRFLSGRGLLPYPRLPYGYLPIEAQMAFAEFEQRATGPNIDPARLWEDFPYHAVADSVENTWADASATLYRNWLREARAALPVMAAQHI